MILCDHYLGGKAPPARAWAPPYNRNRFIPMTDRKKLTAALLAGSVWLYGSVGEDAAEIASPTQQEFGDRLIHHESVRI
jgi:hypothetical protein